MNGPDRLERRTMGEWQLQSERSYASPFADVLVEGHFTGPDGKTSVMPGFFDGDGVWRLRFNPDQAGSWSLDVRSRPHDPSLAGTTAFTVTPRETPGFLNSTPGEAWGFHTESDDPVFIMGDTVYDLFGMAYCGGPVERFLRRRAEQGFNLLRIRVPISGFHPPDGDFAWQTRSMWPWGGSPTSPRFDRFNLDYFRSVDETLKLIETLGFGVELIMEGWGFEFPFNHRAWFTTEWEELWMRTLIARYDAFSAVAVWTPLNEYEYYPNGDWHHKPVSDRWAMRIARWIKATAPHGHIVAMHNGPALPPFAQRFAADPEAVDMIMFQEWGPREEDKCWLAPGLETAIGRSLQGWTGSALLAEWGYERNKAFALKLPHHEFCDRSNTRRGAWRGAFCGLGLIHGFENSWGPWMLLEEDQPGVMDLVHLQRFFTTIVPFAQLTPADHPPVGAAEPGHAPLVMTSRDGTTTIAYLPVGGTFALSRTTDTAQWFDPRTGTLQPASPEDGAFMAPQGHDEDGRPLEWVLVLHDD